MDQIFDAINAATMEGKSVTGIKVSSPDLWRDIHHGIHANTMIGSTPGGMATFCGVPIHFLVNKDGPAFTLEFA